LEALLSRMTTPLLEKLQIIFFNHPTPPGIHEHNSQPQV
jgi:hypothetical protein